MFLKTNLTAFASYDVSSMLGRKSGVSQRYSEQFSIHHMPLLKPLVAIALNDGSNQEVDYFKYFWRKSIPFTESSV